MSVKKNSDYYKDNLDFYYETFIGGVDGYQMTIIKNILIKILILLFWIYQSIVVYLIIKNHWLIGISSEYGIIIDICDVLFLLLLTYDILKHFIYLIYNGSIYFFKLKKEKNDK